MSGLKIERAKPAALSAAFALLPQLAAPDAVVWTARREDGALAGAAGLLWRGWGQPVAMPGWVTVLPDCRRMGVGSALLATIAAAAREEGADVVAVEPIDDTGEAALFASVTGAQAEMRHFFFEGVPANFIDYIGPLVKRLAPRVPAGARIVPLAQAPQAEVKWLIAQEMATAPPRIERMLALSETQPADSAPVDRDHSLVLLVDDTVAAAMLAQRGAEPAGRLSIVCNVVAPAWRGGWVNALMLDHFTRLALAVGFERIAFDCAETVRDTMGLARRSKAREVAVKTRFRYAASATPLRR